MAIDQRLKRAAQSRNVHLGADARGETDIVNRALRRELAEKPYPLLIIGQRINRFGAGSPFFRRSSASSARFSAGERPAIRCGSGCSFTGFLFGQDIGEQRIHFLIRKLIQVGQQMFVDAAILLLPLALRNCQGQSRRRVGASAVS